MFIESDIQFIFTSDFTIAPVFEELSLKTKSVIVDFQTLSKLGILAGRELERLA